MKLRTEGVTWQDIDGELVILDMETSAYLTTNITGTVLAKRLRDECTIDDLVGTLTEEFGIGTEAASHDARAFIEQLRERKLLLEG